MNLWTDDAPESSTLLNKKVSREDTNVEDIELRKSNKRSKSTVA